MGQTIFSNRSKRGTCGVLFVILILCSPFPLNFGSGQILPQTQFGVQKTAMPTLEYCTFFGGMGGTEIGLGIAVAGDGSYYLTGRTSSGDFPTLHAFNYTYSGRDAFVSKFVANGTLCWSTYLGGSDLDYGYDIAVASDGSCYVTGTTWSSNFPTKNAYNATYGSGIDVATDAFLSKFATNGTLLWSTYLGGNNWDMGCSVATTSDGSCYVTGLTSSTNFPTEKAFDSTFNGGYDVFVSKFDPDGALLWSTYLGGEYGGEWGYGVAVASDDSCYITGFTSSIDFPTQNAINDTYAGDWDAFITKFSSNGSLLWSTFFGGSYWDESLGIAVAGDDSCYITGFTGSPDFPMYNAHNHTYGGYGDAFVVKLAKDGSLLWSTFLGGYNGDRGYDIAVSSEGSCYVVGETSSSDFPVQGVSNSTIGGIYDAFITKFSPSGSLLWSTYLGGDSTDRANSVVVASDGSCYVMGETFSSDFPTTQNAYRNFFDDHTDAFIAIFVEPTKCNYGYFAFLVIIPIIAIPIIIFIVRKKQQ